jgi:phosphatidylserine/phosphatidylglycerophosphate/cardiolipin synthase-like enzyme
MGGRFFFIRLGHIARQAKYLHRANLGIPTTIVAMHKNTPDKIMLIGGEIAVTGSFHFTGSTQEQNAENLLIIRDQVLATPYTENWQAYVRHSESYIGRGAARWLGYGR